MKQLLLLILCCTFYLEARGQVLPLFGGKAAAKSSSKTDRPLVVLPDHLKDKDNDDFEKMKQEISEGFGLKIESGSYDEAAALRGQLQTAQKSNPSKANLGVLGGSKFKQASGKVASSHDDPQLSSVHVDSVASHPVVVPDHLREPDDPRQSHSGAELRIDPNSFYEAAVIRSKIKESQMADLHSAAHPSDFGASQMHHGPSHRVGSTRANETKLLLNKNIFINREFYGANGELLKHEALFNKSKNIWHGNVGHGKNLRDQLTLTQVAVNVNFVIGEGADIEVWKAFRKFSDKHSLTLIAMTNNGLLLVQEQNGKFQVLQQIDLEVGTFCAEVFEKWHDETNSWIGVVIISTPTDIIWYETKGEHTQLEEVWRWNVHKKIVQVKYFRHKNTDLVLLVNDNTPSSADIYEFDYFEKMFWIAQVLPLEFPSTSLGILRYGDGFLICLPQKDDVLVYEYQKTTFDHGRLMFKEKVAAKNVTMVAGFTVGGYTYLAIGGQSSRILMFTGDSGFVEQNILGDQLENVIYWFPIHVHTYRDDLLLLALRETDLLTHKALDIKGVVWNLDSFRVTSNIPCFDDEEDVTKGLTCILDPYRKEGLWGSGFVQHHDHLTLVIPQNEAPSALYDLFYEVVPAPDPVIEELQRIEETYELLADIVEYQDRVLENALDAISNAINLEQENYVSELWEIHHMGAKSTVQSENVKWDNDQITFGEKTWTNTDQRRDLATLEEYLAKSESEVEFLTSEVSYNRPLRYSDSPFYPINAVSNGHFDIDSINVIPSFTYKKDGNKMNRNKRNLVVAGPVEFETLELEELEVEHINGIAASDIIFEDGVVELNGPFTFESSVSVDDLINEGKFNGIDLDRELIHFTNPIGVKSPLKFEFIEAIGGVDASHINPTQEKERHFRSINNEKVLQAHKLEINGNVDAKSVNNHGWDAFVSSVVPNNLQTTMEKLTVNGTVFVDHTNLNVVHLNELNFVENLVFGSSQDSYVEITGKKSFNSGLFAQQIDCETLDGIYTPEVITLGDYQKIPGRSVFSSLEVSDDLEVNGKIQGDKLDDFEENLTLEQSRVVDASVIFSYLRVEGPIKIRDTFDGKTIDEVLGNVIYTNNGNVEVNSYKHFKHCDFEEGINIKSALLNGIDTKNIVTKSTQQEIGLNEIHGDVLFHNLELGGLFDFINVTELDMNTVKLSGDQYTEISMSVGHPVDAKFIKIEKDLNGKSVGDFYHLNQELHLRGEITIDELLIDVAHVSGGIHTNGYLNGINLKEFDETRLSLTRPQHITAPCHLQYVTVHGNMKNDVINQVPTNSFTNNVVKAQSVRNLLYSGEILIDHLYVEKNVAIKRLNGIDLNHLLENVVWLNRPTNIYGDLKFLDPLTVYGNLSYAGLLNGQYFESFIQDLALKNQETIHLKAVKGFPNGLFVTTNVDTEYINDVHAKNVVRKDGSVVCQGHVNVHGRADVRYLDIKDTLNNVSLHSLSSSYEYDAQNDLHIIKNDANLHESVQTNNLLVHGSFNSVPDISKYIHSIIRDDRESNITGRKIFVNVGFFDQGVDIGEFNNVELTEFMKDIVLLNPASGKTVIKGLVSFHEPVFAPKIYVQNDVATHNIADCSPQEWVYNGILINQHERILTSLNFNSDLLSCHNFMTLNLNGKPTKDIITLNSAQHLSAPLEVNELYLTGAIHVGGTVNRVKLPLEKENTLMIYGGNQHIATYSTSFASLRVLQDLTVEHLNGILTQNIATLVEDLYFDSPLEFKAIETTSLNTEDHISGVDFNYWCDHSLSTGPKSHPQKVYKNWTVEELYLESSMGGNGLLNHIKVDEIVQSIAKSKTHTDENIVGVAKEYQDVCHSIKAMSENAKTGIYFFKYFEQKFELRPFTKGKLHNSHYFTVGNDQFMLLNVDCVSEMYQWNLLEQKFKEFGDKLHTGYVEEVFVMNNASLLILASKKDGCDVEGIALIRIGSNQKLVPITNLKQNIQNLHQKESTRAFYGLLDNSKVVEYDENLQEMEEWLLPETVTNYRFLPHELGIGLALSDGRTIVALSSMKGEIHRNRRQIDSESDFRNAEWRQIDEYSSLPPVIYKTLNPDDYFVETTPKFSEVLRKEAAYDLSTPPPPPPPDYYDSMMSPSWKYLHNEKDVVKANLEAFKSTPDRPSKEQQIFESVLRTAAAEINRRFDTLRDWIVTTPINNLTELPVNNLIISNFDTPFELVRLGRTTESPYKEEERDFYPPLPSTEETNFANQVRSAFIKWNEATYRLKNLLIKMNGTMDDSILGVANEEKNTTNKVEMKFEDSQFTSHLRDLVSKWNQRGSQLKEEIQSESTTVSDPLLTQELELKEVIKQKLPNLNSLSDSEFNDQFRGLVGKYNNVASKLKDSLDATRYVGNTEEPLVAQTKVLEDLIQKQLLQSTSDNEYAQGLRALVSEWNVQADSLENAVRNTNIAKDLEPFLTKTNEIKPLITKLPNLQVSEEEQFNEQIRSAVQKWNDATSKVNNILESNPKEIFDVVASVLATESSVSMTKPPLQSSDDQKYSDQMRGQLSKWNEMSQKISSVTSMKLLISTESVVMATGLPEETLTTTKPPLQSSDDQKYSDQMREQLSKWNEISQKISSVTSKKPLITHTTTESHVMLTEMSVLTTKAPEEPKPAIFVTQPPTISRPDDVQMIPDLKKTLFVEQQEQLSTTFMPESRFIPYETTISPISDSDSSTTEPTVAQAIPVGGVRLMENFFLPARDKGEIVLLNVGIEGMQRKLIAISSVVNKRSTIPAQHDVIQIYEDIYEGKLFQSIPCYQPSGLSVIHMRDETLLAFLEGNSGVRVYAYRGIQGLIQISNFNLPKVAHKMQHVRLYQEVDEVHECAKDFLSVTTESDVIFYQAKTEPEKNCKVKASLKCD